LQRFEDYKVNWKNKRSFDYEKKALTRCFLEKGRKEFTCRFILILDKPVIFLEVMGTASYVLVGN